MFPYLDPQELVYDSVAAPQQAEAGQPDQQAHALSSDQLGIKLDVAVDKTTDARTPSGVLEQ